MPTELYNPDTPPYRRRRIMPSPPKERSKRLDGSGTWLMTSVPETAASDVPEAIVAFSIAVPEGVLRLPAPKLRPVPESVRESPLDHEKLPESTVRSRNRSLESTSPAPEVICPVGLPPPEPRAIGAAEPIVSKAEPPVAAPLLVDALE